MDSAEIKEYAQMLYNENFKQKDIAKKIHKSPNTVSGWALKGHWKEQKETIKLSRQSRLQELYKELEALNTHIAAKDKKFADSKESDIRRKLVKDIQDLEGKFSLPQTIQTGKEVSEFIRPIDIEFAKKFQTYFTAYINDKIDKIKWQK